MLTAYMVKSRGAQIGYFEEPVPVLVHRIRTGSVLEPVFGENTRTYVTGSGSCRTGSCSCGTSSITGSGS